MLLELDRLSVSYGSVNALVELTASIDSKALGLLGPNGAGKSTLIRALLGHIKPSSGSARLEGLDIRHDVRRIRELSGYMPEHESFISGMTVVRYLRLIGGMCGLEDRAAMERTHEVLFYVGLGEVRYRKLDGFSYGMLQKVRLAQALIHGPKILILDEPTNGLDPAARDEMLSLIRDMIENSGSKFIISSHLLQDIESCCREVMVLKKGKVVAAGNIEEMKQSEEGLFEIRIKGDAVRFQADLKELGCSCRMGERNSMEISTPEGMATRAIFEVARSQGVQVRHFRHKRDTLEDIFLKVLEDESPPEKIGVR